MIQITQTEPDRDRHGNPFIDGERYQRASSASKPVEDQSNLMTWARRDGAKMAAFQPEIAAQVRAAESDRAIDAIVRASRGAADHGTLIHEDLSRALVLGEEPRQPETRDALALLDDGGFHPVASEVFLASRELPYAGTCDLVLEKEGRYYIGDLKTVAPKPYDIAKFAGGSWAAQCAVYAHSHPYCRDEGWMDWGQYNLDLDLDTAFVLLVTRGGDDPGRIVTLDLEVGWRTAQLSLDVLALRKDMKSAAR